MANGDEALDQWLTRHGVARYFLEVLEDGQPLGPRPTQREVPEIHGDLDLRGMEFEKAVNLSGLRIFGSVTLKRCRFHREVKMRGTYVAGDVTLDRSKITMRHLPAVNDPTLEARVLILSRAEIEGRLGMKGFQISDELGTGSLGMIHAVGARIRGGIDARIFMRRSEKDDEVTLNVGLTTIHDVATQSSQAIGVPLWVGSLDLADASIGGRVDLGGARFEGTLRMQRARLESSLTLEWRPHKVQAQEQWLKLAQAEADAFGAGAMASLKADYLKGISTMRTIVSGKLDLDKTCIGGSLLARGLWVGGDVILSQTEVGGTALFRAWHVNEREEEGLDHTLHVRELNATEQKILALRTQIRGRVFARHLRVKNLLNFTGAEIGADRVNASGDTLDLHRAQLGALALGTWRGRDYGEWHGQHSWTSSAPALSEATEVGWVSAFVHGGIQLSDATIAGSARFNGASVSGPITVYGLSVGAQLDFMAFVAVRPNDVGSLGVANVPFGHRNAERPVRDGDLKKRTEDANLSLPTQPTIRGDNTRIGGSLLLSGSDFLGGVYLRGAVIGGGVEADVRGPVGQHRSAWFLGVACEAVPAIVPKVEFESSLRLPFCEIGTDLCLRGAQLASCLSLYGSEIGGGIDAGPWIQETNEMGSVDTRIGRGRVSGRARPAEGKIEEASSTTPPTTTQPTTTQPTAAQPVPEFEASGLVAVKMDYVQVGGDVCLDHPDIAAPVSARGAKIQGSLFIRGQAGGGLRPATDELEPRDLYALDLAAARIGRDLTVMNVHLGGISLVKAEVGGSVRFESRDGGSHGIFPNAPTQLVAPQPTAAQPGGTPTDEAAELDKHAEGIAETVRGIADGREPFDARHVIGRTARNGRVRSLNAADLRVAGSFLLVGYRFLSGIVLEKAEIGGVAKFGSDENPIVVGVGLVQTVQMKNDHSSRAYSLLTRSARFGADVWMFGNRLYAPWNHALAEVSGNLHIKEPYCKVIDLSGGRCAQLSVWWGPGPDRSDRGSVNELWSLRFWVALAGLMANLGLLGVALVLLPTENSPLGGWHVGWRAAVAVVGLLVMLAVRVTIERHGREQTPRRPNGLLGDGWGASGTRFLVEGFEFISLQGMGWPRTWRDANGEPVESRCFISIWDGLAHVQARNGFARSAYATAGLLLGIAMIPNDLEATFDYWGGLLGGLSILVATLWLAVPHLKRALAEDGGSYLQIGGPNRGKAGGEAQRRESFYIALLRRTEFDAGFYAKIEKELQADGRITLAGNVSRMLHRRRLRERGWLDLIPQYAIHTLFGHGTRLTPAIVAYLLLLLSTWYAFSTPEGLRDTRERATSRLAALADYRGALGNDPVPVRRSPPGSKGSAVSERSLVERGLDDTTGAILAERANQLGRSQGKPAVEPAFEEIIRLPAAEGGTDPDFRRGLGPFLRAAVPFATFESGAGLQPSDAPIRLPQWMQGRLVTNFLVARKSTRAMTYSELATLVTLVSWLLIPIFLLKLVTSMRRLEVKDFEG